MTDSYLHGQYHPANSSGHVNAFISNGGRDFVLRHNTLACTAQGSSAGGCTADASLFGDFDPISDATFDNNLFKAANPGGTGGAYCLYGGHQPSKRYPNAARIVVTDNVFERGSTGKCGDYGPVTSFDSSAAGNVWSGNHYTDGSPIAPSD